MSKRALLLKSLLYYWRTNLAVMLGVIAGTAVIGGALVVGDSVRDSLKTMSRERLGRIDFAVSGFRFFREELAAEISADPRFQQRFGTPADTTTSPQVAPALALVGGVEREISVKADSPRYARAGRVNVWGLDERLWSLTEHGDVERPTGNEVVLSQRLADQLQEATVDNSRPLAPDDPVTLSIELPSNVPRDSLLGDRDQAATVQLELTVKAILPDELGVSRLALNPSQQLPMNLFVDLKTLQRSMQLQERRERNAKLRKIVTIPAKVNALFASAATPEDAEGTSAVAAAELLTQILDEKLTLTDAALRVTLAAEGGYLSVESEQQILSPEFARAAEAAADDLQLSTSPVLVYIANRLQNPDDNKVQNNIPLSLDPPHDGQPGFGYSMYSLIAGLPLPTAEGFQDFQFVGMPPAFPLGPDDIILNEWLAEDLKVKVGDQIVMTYFEVGAHIVDAQGRLPELKKMLKVQGIVKSEGTAIDGGLVPEVKGVTDARTFQEVKEPFPMRRDLITDRDEEFWEMFPATPKAFMSLDAAQNLWASRYGKLTSYRVAPPNSTNDKSELAAFRENYINKLLFRISPEDLMLNFRSVKAQGVQAASGTTDFAGLFVGFSFFLILSAAILIGLLLRLGIERRVSQVGLLEAVGFRPADVRRLLLGEGFIVVLVGGACGVLAAIAYAHVMVYGLKTWWIGAIGTRFLYVSVQPVSLILGFLLAVIIAAIAAWWALRQLKHISTRDLLNGVIDIPPSGSQTLKTLSAGPAGFFAGLTQSRSGWIAVIGSGLSLLLLIGVVTGVIPDSEAFMGISWKTTMFFLVGTMLLAVSVAALNVWLLGDREQSLQGSRIVGTGKLGMRNAARNRSRSLLTVSLIASATFVIVAVAAGHRDPVSESPNKASGNGGFTLVADAGVPVEYDLGTPAGRGKLNVSTSETDSVFAETTIVPFRVKPGENASCLNIYQTRLPTILGVPDRLLDRGGFKFVGADGSNVWQQLNADPEDVTIIDDDGNTHTVPAYPVFGDMNTLQYSLHKAVGDVIAAPNDSNPDHALKIVGMLDGSVFQGVLLMGERRFNQLYPQYAGSSYFLIDTPVDQTAAIQETLETELSRYGFDAEPVGKRLQNFLEVQNTYLSTFLALGGLGLLLGTLGLATVMLRNVLERRGELALLRGVGFQRRLIGLLVLSENALLLTCGLVAGTVSALLAMLPHVTGSGADVPWAGVITLLVAVFIIGMLAALAALTEAVRTPILSTLRSE